MHSARIGAREVDQNRTGIICVLFIPVVLAAHIIAALEPVPVFCVYAIRFYGAITSRLAHGPPMSRVSAERRAFCLAAGVIASDQTPNPCGLLLAPVSPVKAARENHIVLLSNTILSRLGDYGRFLTCRR